MTAALEQWSNHYGDLPLFATEPGERPAKAPTRPRSKLKPNHAYPVLIRSAKMVKSQHSSDVQIEIDFEVDEMTKHLYWLTLPMQHSDLQRDKEQVAKMTLRRMQSLQRLYAACNPYDFALYETCKETDDGKLFFDFQGELMRDRNFVERHAHIQAMLKKHVAVLHDSVGRNRTELVGASLYIVVVPNARNPNYPFTNIYAQPPYKYPLHNPEQASSKYTEAPF